MARVLRAWAINRRGKNSVCNLRYRPQTRLARGIYSRSAAAVVSYYCFIIVVAVIVSVVCFIVLSKGIQAFM